MCDQKLSDKTHSSVCHDPFCFFLVSGEAAAAWWSERPKNEVTDQVITCSYVRQLNKV